MADAENFEDDLFADLYDDNEPATAPAPAAPVVQAPTAPAQPIVEAPSRVEPDQVLGDVAPTTEEHVAYDDTYQDEAYDDDDDVDFNLGNDQSSVTATTAAHPQHEESTSTYHSSRGSGAKEDG